MVVNIDEVADNCEPAVDVAKEYSRKLLKEEANEEGKRTQLY